MAEVRDTTAVLLWPARMTWVGPETITSLIEAHGTGPAHDAAARPGTASPAGRSCCRRATSTPCARRARPDAARRHRGPRGRASRAAGRGRRPRRHPRRRHAAATTCRTYEGPPDPPAGHTHEWGADVAAEAGLDRLTTIATPDRGVPVADRSAAARRWSSCSWSASRASCGTPSRSRSCPRRRPRWRRRRTVDLRRRRRPDHLHADRRPADDRAHPVSGRQGPAGRLCPAGPRHRGARLPRRHRVGAVQPRRLRHRCRRAGHRGHPEIEHWAVGGHSLGGVDGRPVPRRPPGRGRGLVLWASYSAADLRATGPGRRLDLRHARHRHPVVHEPERTSRSSARRDLHGHRGRQSRADGLVHRPAERPAGDDLASRPAGPGRRGDRRDCSTRSATRSA